MKIWDKNMTYQQLDQNTVIDYLKNTVIFSHLITDQTKATEVGDGNINFVYIISGLKEEKKLVVKQAVPYLRIIGESFALAKERIIYESESLKLFSSLSPQYVPQVFHADHEMALMVMQCLDSHIIMRKGLIAEIRYPHFVEHITDFLASTLFYTSSLYLSGKEKRALMKEYVGNDELCKITEDFVFTTPYMPHDTNPENLALQEEIKAIQEDFVFKLEAIKLKNKFMNQTDALIHGDLHTGSIMINQTETFVIDSEFACFGPVGFDVGAVIANLLLSYVSHVEQSDNHEYHAWLLNTAISVYLRFEEKFLVHWSSNQNKPSGLLSEKAFYTPRLFETYQQDYMKEILQDTIGFAGMKMARRILGVARVADIVGIQDASTRQRAEKRALSIAIQLVKERKNFSSMLDILPILKKEHELAK